jgi:hypothetical protein
MIKSSALLSIGACARPRIEALSLQTSPDEESLRLCAGARAPGCEGGL